MAPVRVSHHILFFIVAAHLCRREHHAATVAVRCENIRNFHSCAIPVKTTLFPHFLPNRFLVRDLPLAGQVRSLSNCPQSSGSAILGCWTLAVLCISTNCQCNFHVQTVLSYPEPDPSTFDRWKVNSAESVAQSFQDDVGAGAQLVLPSFEKSAVAAAASTIIVEDCLAHRTVERHPTGKWQPAQFSRLQHNSVNVNRRR